ncbi:MAG: hypothetical protein U1F39_07065 [Steroidobacteraceae bacterium]
MPTYVAIVGDLQTRPSRREALDALTLRAAGIQWEWVQAEGNAFNLPDKPFRRLLHKLRECRDADSIAVVKLPHIHGRDENTLYRAWNNLLLPPRRIETAEQLVEWLLSIDAGLVGTPIWEESPRGAALLAVLSKLVKNKDWNKDVQGHHWTKEDDLLGQSPVSRPEFPTIYVDACEIVERAADTLLLTKGGKQGKTPKEWSINIQYLSPVKRVFVERSLAALQGEATLGDLFRYIQRDDRPRIEIDDAIASEKVIAICMELER